MSAASDAAPGEFGALLHALRQRAHLSQGALAKSAGIDPSYVNRLERGEREPPKREIVAALAAGLRLPPQEEDQLLVAAGHLPRALQELGPLDPTITMVADILADAQIPLDQRRQFRQQIALAALRWRPAVAVLPSVTEEPAT
jgi:transcriptional regulator with XRE-family HTH domain